MIKLTKLLIAICIFVWGFVFSTVVLANDYNKAVIGHVIQTEYKVIQLTALFSRQSCKELLICFL